MSRGTKTERAIAKELGISAHAVHQVGAERLLAMSEQARRICFAPRKPKAQSLKISTK